MRRLTLIVVGLLLLPGVSRTIAFAAEQREVQLGWGEVSRVILDHEVSLVLADSTRVTGEVIAVTDDTLKLNVTKTSNSRTHAKGGLNIPRSEVPVMELHAKRGKMGSFVGKTAGTVGGVSLGALIIERLAGSLGPVGAISIFAASVGGGKILGDVVGRNFNGKIIRIKIAPASPQAEGRQEPAPTGSEVPDWRGSAMAADVER